MIPVSHDTEVDAWVSSGLALGNFSYIIKLSCGLLIKKTTMWVGE